MILALADARWVSVPRTAARQGAGDSALFLGVSEHWPLCLAAIWLLWNVFGFALMSADKRRAELGLWRVSEATLLSVAFFGGAFGVRMAQRLRRHKTRKQPFAGWLHIAFGLNAAASTVGLAFLLVHYFLAVVRDAIQLMGA